MTKINLYVHKINFSVCKKKKKGKEKEKNAFTRPSGRGLKKVFPLLCPQPVMCAQCWGYEY